MSESVDHKERAEMWFKRAGELVGEVSTQRATAAAATAMAATAPAEEKQEHVVPPRSSSGCWSWPDLRKYAYTNRPVETT